MQTKQLKLRQLDQQIAERSAYLKQVEVQIEEFSTIGNNTLLDLNRQIDAAERELAQVLRRKYEIEQTIRERERLL